MNEIESISCYCPTKDDIPKPGHWCILYLSNDSNKDCYAYEYVTIYKGDSFEKLNSKIEEVTTYSDFKGFLTGSCCYRLNHSNDNIFFEI